MVQIRLLLGKDVQIVFAHLLVVLPGLAAEKAVPVVRQLPAAVTTAPGRAPEVVLMVRIVLVAAELEPLVLCGGVVDNQVHYDPHASLMRSVAHFFEYIQVPVLGVDGPVVGYVVAEVEIRRGIER